MPVGREKTKHAKLSNLKRVCFGMVIIIKQTHLNFRRLVWGGDLLENCAKNASDLRGNREKMKKYENAFFERNRVLFFWPISLINPFIYRPRSIKKKRSQIDSFLTGLALAGRPAARN